MSVFINTENVCVCVSIYIYVCVCVCVCVCIAYLNDGLYFYRKRVCVYV